MRGEALNHGKVDLTGRAYALGLVHPSLKLLELGLLKAGVDSSYTHKSTVMSYFLKSKVFLMSGGTASPTHKSIVMSYFLKSKVFLMSGGTASPTHTRGSFLPLLGTHTRGVFPSSFGHSHKGSLSFLFWALTVRVVEQLQCSHCSGFSLHVHNKRRGCPQPLSPI
jgi:hypothetical protein